MDNRYAIPPESQYKENKELISYVDDSPHLALYGIRYVEGSVGTLGEAGGTVFGISGCFKCIRTGKPVSERFEIARGGVSFKRYEYNFVALLW